MENSESRFAPSSEAESDDFVSPVHPQPGPSVPVSPAPPGSPEAERLYWRGVADGLARAGVPVPSDVAARAGAPPPDPADLLAFDPVPLRRRDDGLTPERQRAYVEALADTGVAREAAARVGLSEHSVARVRRRADARSFDRACEAAHRFGARQLRSIAYQRAVEGSLKGHYYHGKRISEERVFDNRLLIYLLGKTEHLLEPPEESHAICENWEPCMDALEQGLPLPVGDGAEPEDDISGEQVWVEDGIWWTLFPPPEDFDGEEEGELGDSDYQRTLTDEEEARMRDRQRADDEIVLARCCAMRDRFFDLPDRGAPDIFGPREAGPSGPSEALPPGGSREYSQPKAVEPGRDCDHIPGDRSSEGGSG